MDIRGEKIFLSWGDIPLSRIVKLFLPQERDEGQAKVFLSENSIITPEGEVRGARTQCVEVLAVYTASKGETLKGILEAISGEGWRYATLWDWYRYHTNFPFPGGEAVATPGTTCLDENYREWFPFVSPCPRKGTSLFQRIIKKKKENKIIAEIFMKGAGPLIKLPGERKILISQVIVKK